MSKNLIVGTVVMPEEKKIKPGDGLRSIKTTALFRALNFELYARPNKVIMALGATVFLASVGYITYMQYKYEGLGYYPGVKEDGSEQYMKRKSNWD